MELDLLFETAGAERSMEYLLKYSDISVAELENTMAALSPQLIARFNLLMRDRPGRIWLRGHRESGGPQQFIDRPGLMLADLTDIEGERMLNFLFGGPEAAGQLQADLADTVGIKQELLAPVLFRLVCLFVGAICKQVQV